MEDAFWIFVVVGFCAQVVDGALGMAYGITAASLFGFLGVSPAITSAAVHTAETFTTGTSLVAHHYFANIDWKLFRRLVAPAVIGAFVGASVLTALSGQGLRPFIAAYLLVMGVIIVVKAFRKFPPVSGDRQVSFLGFGGACADAIGGGGWGPIVSSTLIARGNDTRRTIGTVNAVEFFVTLTVSLVLLATISPTYWKAIAGLAVGGGIAAPVGAYLCQRLPLQPLMVLVGGLIILISGTTLVRVWL